MSIMLNISSTVSSIASISSVNAGVSRVECVLVCIYTSIHIPLKRFFQKGKFLLLFYYYFMNLAINDII